MSEERTPKLIYGIAEPKPFHPELKGKFRVRMREGGVARVFIKTPFGVDHWLIDDLGDHWGLCLRQGSNHRTNLPEGVALIDQERMRQIHLKGYSAEHDDTHGDRELLRAGLAYLLLVCNPVIPTALAEALWPWKEEQLRLNASEYPAYAIEALTKAGALIVAELDRILREGK